MAEIVTTAKVAQLPKYIKSVLIKTGHSDDALRYHALVTNLAPSSMLAHFHASSLLLERVRLFGEMMVFISLDQRTFTAKIMPSSDGGDTLELEIIDCLEDDIVLEKRISLNT